jgi:hypothetical protein
VQHLLDPGPRRGRDCRGGTPVFAIKGETLEEYWDYTDRIFQFGGEGGTCNMILDDGGDATLYILMGARVEAGETDLIAVPTSEEEVCLFARSASVWPPAPAGSPSSATPSRACPRKPPRASSASMTCTRRATCPSRRST